MDLQMRTWARCPAEKTVAAPCQSMEILGGNAMAVHCASEETKKSDCSP